MCLFEVWGCKILLFIVFVFSGKINVFVFDFGVLLGISFEQLMVVVVVGKIKWRYCFEIVCFGQVMFEWCGFLFGIGVFVCVIELV